MPNLTLRYEIVAFLAIIIAFDAWERWRPGHAVDRRRHLRLDVLAILVVIVFGQTWKTLLVGLFDWLDARAVFAPLAFLRGLPSALKIVLALTLADLCLYWVHWAMHRFDLLWRTHAFHHTIEDLYWLSGARTSVLHLLLFALPQVLISFYLFDFTLGEAAIAFSIGTLVNVWVHTNLRVNLGLLEWLFITPDYHRVHHAANELSRRNLGFIFTIWDRAFGTYVDPRTVPAEFPLGMAEAEENVGRLIVGV